MKGMKLLIFEVKHQTRTKTFIVVLLLFALFIATQMKGVFHYPVHNIKDIEALESNGIHEYLFMPTSEKELTSNTIKYLQKNLENGHIPAEKKEVFQGVIEKLKRSSFSQVYISSKDEWVVQWLDASNQQFHQRIGSIEEINSKLRSAVESTEYSSQLYKDYVTYMQIAATFLIYPIFLLLITRDWRHNMYEIIQVQPITSTKYILYRYLGTLIPLLFFFYTLGILLNLISTFRFESAGWKVTYTFFLRDFLVFILPTVVFLSALLMFLMFLFKKAIVVTPIYIAYVILNVTPGAFEGGGHLGLLSRVIIRLDGQSLSFQDIMMNRAIYLFLSFVFIFLSFKLFGAMKNDLRKAVTI